MDGWDEWAKWLEENVFFADEEGDDSEDKNKEGKE